MIRTKRVYEAASRADGKRFLVERLWPRGMKKQAVRMEGWIKDAAPSAGLRQWFSHDPEKWNGFQQRYRAELAGNPDAWQPLLEAANKSDITLLFSTRDPEHNNARLLKEFLDERLESKEKKRRSKSQPPM